MEGKYLRLLEATKALINHINREQVFDKAVEMERGSLDTSRSQDFDTLVEKAAYAESLF